VEGVTVVGLTTGGSVPAVSFVGCRCVRSGMTHRKESRSTAKNSFASPPVETRQCPLHYPDPRLPTCIQPAIARSCRRKPPPLMLSTPTRAPSHLLPAMLEQASHGHWCLCTASLLVEENSGACSTRHESPSRLLRRFRRRAPPRKGACGLPNHRTSLLFLTALQEFETRLLLCRPKRIARLKPNR
jgi:hypothetical protein